LTPHITRASQSPTGEAVKNMMYQVILRDGVIVEVDEDSCQRVLEGLRRRMSYIETTDEHLKLVYVCISKVVCIKQI
jgi:hypothetical protein